VFGVVALGDQPTAVHEEECVGFAGLLFVRLIDQFAIDTIQRVAVDIALRIAGGPRCSRPQHLGGLRRERWHQVRGHAGPLSLEGRTKS